MESLDTVAKTVLRRRYLRRDENGNVVETPAELFRRVAETLARAEGQFGGDVEATEQEFYEAMTALEFLPNSPTLMNAGTELGQLAACFVLPVEDSLESIFTALKQAALVHQSGGGTGFSFSNLRPEGDVVKKTSGVASGPVSFMQIFDAATEQIKQGGRRRGANMGILDATHPDVEPFVTAKEGTDAFRNFNLSVATDATFWEAHDEGEPYDLVNPRTDEVVGQADPDDVLDLIAETAWETGDPGLLFLETINNEHNPTPHLGRLEATNPCGEVPLRPYEACVLGSINLAGHTDGGEVDWEKLRETARLGVRFLDNAIEQSEFPVPEIEERMAETRKVGLGVMGFHDMLVDLEIPYYSREAVEFAGELMAFIRDESRGASERLADERGPFPEWEDSILEEPSRNATTTTTIAPHGDDFAHRGVLGQYRTDLQRGLHEAGDGGLEIVNDRFVELAKERGFYAEELMSDLCDRTTIQNVAAVPDDVKPLFHTAHDVPADGHLRIQAAFQEHVDNAVSKTINLPQSASVEDVKMSSSPHGNSRSRESPSSGRGQVRAGTRRDAPQGGCAGECDYVAVDGGLPGPRY